MKLSKKQIQQVDTYLIKQRINYWDIRLEMIDHLATKLEEDKELVLDDKLLFKEFGAYWKIQKMIKQKRIIINKKYRKLFNKEIINFFKSIKNIFIFLLLFYIHFQLFKELEPKTFKRLSLIIYMIPIVVILTFFIINLVRKNKSIHLEYAMFYFMFSFIMFNMVIQFTNPNGFFNATPKTQIVVLFISVPIYLILAYCGFKVYYKTHKEYTKIYKELRTI